MRQKKEEELNKIYFVCTSGSKVVGLIHKPTSKVVSSVVEAWGFMVFPSLAAGAKTLHCYSKKGKKRCSSLSNHYTRTDLLATAESRSLFHLYVLTIFIK